MLFTAGKCVAQENDIPMLGDTIIYFQPETANQIKTIEFNTRSSFVPNPKKAVLFAVVCPGLGQIYNRKYWKLPIIYGAFTGLAYGIAWNNRYYVDYRQAYSDFIDDDESTNSWINMLPPGMTETPAGFQDRLARNMDIYRRNRDLCIIGAAGVYILSIVDAFVDAQLFEFDISPDLTLNIAPQMQVVNKNTAVGLQCRLRF